MKRLEHLQTRLNIAFILLAIVPLVIVSVLISQRSIDVIQQDARTYLLERSKHIASEVDAFIEGRTNTLLYMAKVNGLSDNEQSALINGMLAFDTTFQEIAVLNAEGMEVERVSRSDVVQMQDLHDRSDSPEFLTIVQEDVEVYYSDVRFDADLREPLMTIAVPITDRRTGELYKVLVADFRFRSVWEILDTQEYRTGETAYVVNESGEIVAHRNLSATLGDAPPATLPDSDTGLMIKASGEEVLFAAQSIDVGTREFFSVAEQSTRQALSLANDVQVIAVTAITVMLLIVGALIILVVRYFVRPIEHLSQVAEQIANGDLTSRAHIQGHGEISSLAHSFNAMADQLSGLIIDLEQRLEDLRRSEEKYRLLTENAHDLVYRVKLTPQMHFEYVSPVSTSMVGYSPEEHYSDPNLGVKLVHPDDRHLLQNVAERDPNEPLVLRWIRKDGSIIWTEQNNTLILDEEGNVVAIEGIARDITKRKEAEDAVREKQKLLRTLADNYPRACISVIERDFTISFAAGRALYERGLDPDTLVGLTVEQVFDSYTSTALETVRSNYQRVFTGEEAYFELHTNEQFQAHKAVPLPDESGEIRQILAVVENITERKRMEIELREKHAELERFFTLAPNLLCIADTNGRFIKVNPMWEDVLGYPVNSLEGKRFLDFVHPDDRKPTEEAMAQLELQQHPIKQFVNRYRTHDGEYRFIEWNSHPSGKYLYAAAQDVTERQQAEQLKLDIERLKASFQKEQAQNALIQRIISMLSHDLRTPLAVIASSRDMLVQYYERLSEEKRREKLETIGRQVQFALELLQDTVDMARGNLNEGVFNPSPTNLAMLCEVSVQEIEVARRDNHRVRFVNKGDVETASIDEILVSRILLNLLSNALKYSPNGGEIRLELDHRDEWIVLRVIDNGMGITEDDLPQLFDLFYRANEVQHIEGTGLGLSIVKDCVDRHHGHIYVESKPGQGSIFTVELPGQVEV